MVDPKKIVDGLTGIVGGDLIKTEPDILAGYAVDGVMPKAVIFPRNTREVSEVVKFANREDLAISPLGQRFQDVHGEPS